MLMPASRDAKKDREIFPKVLIMDDEGVWQRVKEAGTGAPWRNEDLYISRTVFDALAYADRLRYPCAPCTISGFRGRCRLRKALEEYRVGLGTHRARREILKQGLT